MTSKSGVTIREVKPDVWTFSRPFDLFNRLPVGGRSTAIKLTSGDVWILASTPLTDATKTRLNELGSVRYIVAGNAFHHIFLKQYKDEYPNAVVIGPHVLNAKKAAEGWQLDAVFDATGSQTPFGFEEEIEFCYFSGYKNHDVAFYHKASKTVMAADLLFNLPGTEQYLLSDKSPSSIILGGLRPSGWLMRFLIWTKQGDLDAMRRDAQKVAGWDFETYIPCHGNVIESNAKKSWIQAYSGYMH